MNYDFTSRKKENGRIVFTLTLDKKRLTERIVIAKMDEARRRLEHNDVEVYYDETRHIGSLLLNFESDTSGEWSKNGMLLRESYSKISPIGSARWKMATPASGFLKEKYDSSEPSATLSLKSSLMKTEIRFGLSCKIYPAHRPTITHPPDIAISLITLACVSNNMSSSVLLGTG